MKKGAIVGYPDKRYTSTGRKLKRLNSGDGNPLGNTIK